MDTENRAYLGGEPESEPSAESRWRCDLRSALLAGIACLTLGGCGAAPFAHQSDARPNVLLITIDTLRADHLGAYGYERPTSPNIDRLAAEGAVFETAYAPTGATCPSHATLFTSRSPIAHRVTRNGLHLPEAELTLAEIMAANGYQTAAFVSSYPVSHSIGFDQGFAHFDDVFEPSRFSIPLERWMGHDVGKTFDRPGEATTEATLAWLDTQASGEPLFLWVHLFDPHYPYRPPQQDLAPFVGEPGATHITDIDLYDGEIHAADRQVGHLVERFTEVSGDAAPLVILTSDHGEGLEDHGWRSHNRTLYEEELRVPLIFHWPGRLHAGTRVLQPAGLLDVLPSIVTAVELEDGDVARDGIDLLPYALGHVTADPQRPIWLQRPVFDPETAPEPLRGNSFGVRMGRWKLIDTPEMKRRELYDLVADPSERVNLAHADRPRSDAMAGAIAEWHHAEGNKAIASDLGPNLEDIEALEALGYVQR